MYVSLKFSLSVAMMLLMGSVVQRSAEAANLFPNASFEAGIDTRFAVGRWYVDGLPSAVLDETTRVHGRYSLKIPFSRVTFQTPSGITVRAAVPVTLVAGRRYRFTAAVKASQPVRATIVLTTNNAADYRADQPLASREVFVRTDWNRTGITYVPPETQEVYWEIRARAERAGHLWLDAIYFGPNDVDEDDYHPAAPVEAGITVDRLGHIFDSGETPVLTVMVFNDMPRPATAQSFRLEVRDVAEDLVHTAILEYTVPGHGGIRLPVALPVLPNGVYRATLVPAGAEGPKALSEVTFSVLPRPRPVAAADGAFGAYITVAPEPLAIMRRVGFSWIATLTSNNYLDRWGGVEQEEGRFLWYDEDVAAARDLGFEFLFDLEPCRTPAWAREMSIEQRREKFLRYVREIVAHYSEAIKYWTIADEVHNFRENEPHRNCWTSAAEYVEWHHPAYRTIKAVDPEATVVLNTLSSFAAEILDILPATEVDILAANVYHFPRVHRSMPEVARRHNIAQVWAPGIGVTVFPFYRAHHTDRQRDALRDGHWRDKNRELATSVIQTFAAGFRRLFHYTATYVGNTNHFSLFEADSGLRTTGAQFAALIWLLDGFDGARELDTGLLEPDVRAFRLDRKDGRTVFALWGPPAADQRVSLAGVTQDMVSVYDNFANPIDVDSAGQGITFTMGRAPIFLVTPTNRAVAVDRAMRAPRIVLQALPDAESVEIAGRYAVLRGLNDGIHRFVPNISLWYRSTEYGWTEIMRQRDSTFEGEYRATDEGFMVSWRPPEQTGGFFLEPGQFPRDLIGGARFWRSKRVDGRIEWIGGRVDYTTQTVTPDDAPPPQADGLGEGSSLLMALSNGMTLRMETTIEPGDWAWIKNTPGGWGVFFRIGFDVFLHRGFPSQPAPRKVTTRISVVDAAPR